MPTCSSCWKNRSSVVGEKRFAWALGRQLWACQCLSCRVERLGMSHRSRILATYHFLLFQVVIEAVGGRNHGYPYETSRLPECLTASRVACGNQLSLPGSYQYPECLGETWMLSYSFQYRFAPSQSLGLVGVKRTPSYSFQVQSGPFPWIELAFVTWTPSYSFPVRP